MLKYMHWVKFNNNYLSTFQFLVHGGRMRGVHAKKEGRKSMRTVGKTVGEERAVEGETMGREGGDSEAKWGRRVKQKKSRGKENWG